MPEIPQIKTNPDDTATWVKYHRSFCDHCQACCCSLQVEVKSQDLIRMQLIDEFELDENPKKIAKRLKKAGVVEHFHSKSETYSLSRMANGDCLYLDKRSRRCTIYTIRPDTCRQHPKVGPRSGFCAFSPKTC